MNFDFSNTKHYVGHTCCIPLQCVHNNTYLGFYAPFLALVFLALCFWFSSQCISYLWRGTEQSLQQQTSVRITAVCDECLSSFSDYQSLPNDALGTVYKTHGPRSMWPLRRSELPGYTLFVHVTGLTAHRCATNWDKTKLISSRVKG